MPALAWAKLEPYKRTIDRWFWPDVFRKQDTSVSKAKPVSGPRDEELKGFREGDRRGVPCEFAFCERAGQTRCLSCHGYPPKVGKLIDRDLDVINGKREQSIGRVQERCGIANEGHPAVRELPGLDPVHIGDVT